MDERKIQSHRTEEHLRTRVSRGQLLRAGLAGLALGGIPELAGAEGTGGTGGSGFQFPYYPQTSGTYTPESPVGIASNLLTIMYFGVTGTYATVRAAGPLGISGLALSIFQAGLAEQQYQIDFLSRLVPGSATQATTFTAPPGLSSGKAIAAASEVASTIQIGATLAAMREFAEVGQPLLAKYAGQMLGVQSEQRALNRAIVALSGDASYVPPNNKVFETDLFLYTRDALTLLRALGFLGGSGSSFTYPGRDAALAAAGGAGTAVIQRQPNNSGSSVMPGSNLTGERS